MCDLRSVWPMGGPAAGGTRVYLAGTMFSRKLAVTFSFGDDMHLTTANATLVMPGLIEVVTPTVSAGAGVLPRTAYVHFSGCRSRAVQRTTFTFWSVTPPRLPRCFAHEGCDRPPVLFDQLSGLPPTHPAMRHDTLIVRSLPPASRCEDWLALHPMSAASCKHAAQRMPGARWDGLVARHSQHRGAAAGFVGCVYWPAVRGSGSRQGRVQFISGGGSGSGIRGGGRGTYGGGGGCHLWAQGGRCLCIGPPAEPTRTHPCARHLVSLLSKRADLGAATGTQRRTRLIEGSKESQDRTEAEPQRSPAAEISSRHSRPRRRRCSFAHTARFAPCVCCCRHA